MQMVYSLYTLSIHDHDNCILNNNVFALHFASPTGEGGRIGFVVSISM